MDRPHRWHQTDPLLPRAPGGDRLAQRRDASRYGNPAPRHR
jgi:hypothetical protein